jgi:hypothetical protein
VDDVADRIVISHAGKDRAWAEWARWYLEKAGYPTELDSVDRAPGTNVMEAMDKALKRDNPLLVLLSPAYLDPDLFTTDEWTTRLAQRRKDPNAKLIPLRIDNVDLHNGLWASIVVPDVFDLGSDEAVALLLDAVRRVVDPASSKTLPAAPPVYPGRAAASAPAGGPRPPGSLPTVWNLARRNPGFTGRDEMLNRLHDTLRSGSQVAVQALEGMGGVGKTQLALEYAHRFAGEYDLAWWIPSEQPELMGDHLASLAQKLRLVPVGTATPEAVEAQNDHLRQAARWLLIFDNAEGREDLSRWLPDGRGHVLITSRNPNWTGIAQPMDVDIFARPESITLVRTHLPHLTEADADRLADALGDLPLAVGQAVDLLAETRMPVSDYLEGLAANTAELMGEGRAPAGYPVPLAATVTLTADRLTDADPVAGQLLYLCAHLGPEPIPTDIFTARPDLLPEPLQSDVRRPVAFRRALGTLARHGLARLTDAGPVLHRLVQAVLRDTDSAADSHHAIVEHLITAVAPDDASHPRWWPRWNSLLPHILAMDPATTDNVDLRYTANAAVWHLMARGDDRNALPLAQQLHQAWNEQHGPDDAITLAIANTLAVIHSSLGQHQQAHDLNKDSLGRERRLRGDDHHHTLSSAGNLAINLRQLGEHEQARELGQDTLTRQRRLLGDDHPSTLRSANNLAIDHTRLGEFEQARELLEDTLIRRERILGYDHPETLASASNLAGVLRQLDDYDRAHELSQDAFARHRRVLGDDHPATVRSAIGLALTLEELGRHDEARALREQFSSED